MRPLDYRNIVYWYDQPLWYAKITSKPEGVISLRFGCFLLDTIGLGGSLERHGHAKSDPFLPLADLPFPFEPSLIGVEWSGLQVAADALFQRKQGVPEAKCHVPDYVKFTRELDLARQ